MPRGKIQEWDRAEGKIRDDEGGPVLDFTIGDLLNPTDGPRLRQGGPRRVPLRRPTRRTRGCGRKGLSLESTARQAPPGGERVVPAWASGPRGSAAAWS